MADERSELLAAADAIERAHPRAAGLLRAAAAADQLPTPDPRRLRKLVLRRLWRDQMPDLPRTAAARILAAQWAAWSAGDDLPGSMGAAFARLDRAGFRSIGWRQIADDLDADLDPPGCNFAATPERPSGPAL